MKMMIVLPSPRLMIKYRGCHDGPWRHHDTTTVISTNYYIHHAQYIHPSIQPSVAWTQWTQWTQWTHTIIMTCMMIVYWWIIILYQIIIMNQSFMIVWNDWCVYVFMFVCVVMSCLYLDCVLVCLYVQWSWVSMCPSSRMNVWNQEPANASRKRDRMRRMRRMDG